MKIRLPFILALIATLFVVSIYSAFNYGLHSRQPSPFLYENVAVLPFATPLTSPAPSPVTIKTYNSKTYGFTLVYPSFLSITEGVPTAAADQSNLVVEFLQSNLPLSQQTVQIDITAARTNLSINQWLKKVNHCQSADFCKSTMPAAIPGSQQYESLQSHYASLDTYLINNGYLFDISMSALNPAAPFFTVDRDTYNQIISSFKFTNPNPNSGNKTY